MLARARQRFGEGERGQAIFIFLVVITIVLVVGVMVVDVGLWLSERRHAQSAADLAALAAATELRNSNALATARGIEYARRNGFDSSQNGVTVEVNPRYNGDPDLVEVRISEDAPALFGHIFGLANMNIDARAVARVSDTPLNLGYAIFADRRNNNCNPQSVLRVLGSGNSVNGQVHSNGDLYIDAPNSSFTGGTTYTGCFNSPPSSTTFNPPPRQDSARQAPIGYNYQDFACTRTFSGPNTNLESEPTLWVNNNVNTNQLKNNVICSDGNITLGRDNVSGIVTIVSDNGRVTLTGNNFDLTPAWDNVLIFSARSSGGGVGCGSNPAIQMEVRNSVFRGYIHAPDGNVEFELQSCVQASGNQIFGSIVAGRVRINGSNNTLDATGTGQTLTEPLIFLEE
jgi:Flp pilus assembly protein TadG